MELHVGRSELRSEIIAICPEKSSQTPGCLNGSFGFLPLAAAGVDDAESEVERAEDGDRLWGFWVCLTEGVDAGLGGVGCLVELLEGDERVCHAKEAGHHAERLLAGFGDKQGSIGCDPGGVSFVEAGEGCRCDLISLRGEFIQALAALGWRLTAGHLDGWKQLHQCGAESVET
ncbi:MAG: hypothetical protein WCG47_19505 [Dermatophilaceae bacterium]